MRMVNEAVESLADEFIRRVSEHPTSCRIDKSHLAVHVHSDDPLAYRFKEQPDAFFRYPQLIGAILDQLLQMVPVSRDLAAGHFRIFGQAQSCGLAAAQFLGPPF